MMQIIQILNNLIKEHKLLSFASIIIDSLIKLW